MFQEYTKNVPEYHDDIPKCIKNIRRMYLNVSRIMVNKTNFPSKGTTSDVGGIISANRRKKTVRESRMLIERLT